MQNSKENKPKVIVFGAGGGGQKFIKNCKGEYEFIAFSDNNETKFDTTIDGIKVIKPKDILNANYNFIIIASMWVKEISNQLIGMGIKKEKIMIPPKNKLKNGTPFANEDTKKFGREMIFWITDLMIKHGIDVYVDFGTLLGFVRDGDILDWDDDIDMSVNDFDFDKMTDIMAENRNKMLGRDYVEWKGDIVYDNDGNKYGLSLDCIPKENGTINRFDLYIRSRRRKDGYSIPMGAVGNLFIPEKHFNGCDDYDYKGSKLKLPNLHKEYLRHVYGQWEIPKKGVTFTFYKSADMSPFGKTDDSPLLHKHLF